MMLFARAKGFCFSRVELCRQKIVQRAHAQTSAHTDTLLVSCLVEPCLLAYRGPPVVLAARGSVRSLAVLLLLSRLLSQCNNTAR